jgi:arginine/lysine/ornithine decarboxylase
LNHLDDLHAPKGIIKQAQDLAAEAFGADHTRSFPFKEQAAPL